MGSMKKWMLAIALAVGTLGLGASQANAAQIRFGVYVGAPDYVPPCPGPGYAWVAGYYNNGYWVPGFWRAPEPGYGVYAGSGYGYWHGRDRDHWNRDRDDYYRDRDDRRWDRDDRYRDHDGGDRFHR